MKRDHLLFVAAIVGLGAALVNLVPSLNAAKTTVEQHPEARPHIAWGLAAIIGIAIVLAMGTRR